MSASTKKKLRKEENAAKLTEKQLAEQKEAKKLKGYTTAFAVVVSLVLVAAVVIMGVTTFNNSGILERNTDALTVGEHTLNNAELNYFYVDAVNEFYSTWQEQYGEYAGMYMSMMGIDATKPLNKLPYTGGEEGETYADYFKDQAITNASNTYTIYDLAVKDGQTVSDEVKASYESTFAMFEMYANIYGYSDMEEYLQAIYGPGASEETYRTYLDVLALADSYQADYYESLTYDDAALAAHNEEHFNEFSSFDYCQYLITVHDFVPHDENSNEHDHSDEETAAAEAAAKAAADSLAAAEITTAEELNEAINALEVYADAETEKTCTENKGILFDNIGNTEASAWLAEEGRVAGDLTVLPSYLGSGDSRTLNGYYVILFLNREDNNMNLVNVRHILSVFEGGTKDPVTGKTTYSTEEKAAALKAITTVQEQWLADGGTEEAFIALVKDNSDDTGSSSSEGLYEKVYPGQMVSAFNDWCFASERKHGDYEIVESEYGYHLMYFVDHADVTFRNYMIENTLRNTDYETWYTETTGAADPKELNTKYLSLDMVLSNS